MILKIDVTPENVLYCKDGRIVVKVKFYSQFAHGAHLCTTEGETLEDFNKADVKRESYLYVGQRGGISCEKVQS